MDLDALTGQIPGGRKYYKQLLVLQDSLFKRAMSEQQDNSKAAACARAWEVLEERKRIMRGRMKPGSINARDDSAAKGRSKRSQPKSSPAPGPVVYPAPSAESAPRVVSDKGEKPSEDGPKEGV